MNAWPPPPPWDCPNPWCYDRAGHGAEHRSRTGRPFLAYPGDVTYDPPPTAPRPLIAVTHAAILGAVIGFAVGVLSLVWFR